jgi:hypothetical protein
VVVFDEAPILAWDMIRAGGVGLAACRGVEAG